MRLGPLGLPEIIIILVIVLLLFGARRLPEMARSIGQSVREFRKGIRDMKEDIERDDEDGEARTSKYKKTKAEAAGVRPVDVEEPTPADSKTA